MCVFICLSETSESWHPLRKTLTSPPSSGCDDCPALSRLALRPHRILGLLPAFRLPTGWIRGGPPSPRRCPILPSQNQGGAERRCSQEKSEKSWVGMALGPGKSASDSPPRRPPRDGVSHSFSRGRGNLTSLPKETLSIRGAFCVFSTGQGLCIYTETKTQQLFSHFNPTWKFKFQSVFRTCAFRALNTAWQSTCSGRMGHL